MTEAEAIDRYFALLQSQLDRADDWPDAFTFPEPDDSDERRAFEAFIRQVRSAGMPVEPVHFTDRPGRA